MSSKAATRATFSHRARICAIVAGTLMVLATPALFLRPARSPTGPHAEHPDHADFARSDTMTELALQQRIAAQDEIIAMTEALKLQLAEPRPIWGSERAALPYNHEAIQRSRERIAVLERDLATARRLRDALVASMRRSARPSPDSQPEEP